MNRGRKALTNIDESNALLLNETDCNGNVLQPLRVVLGTLVVSTHSLLREHFQQGDKVGAVREVIAEVSDKQAGFLQMLVAPASEGLLLNALPLGVQRLLILFPNIHGPDGKRGKEGRRKREKNSKR